MKIDRRKGHGYFKDFVIKILILLAIAIVLVLAGVYGCKKNRSRVREYLNETGEMPHKETLEEVRLKPGTEERIYCGACCSRAVPGYKYCQGHLDLWVTGGTNAGND